MSETAFLGLGSNLGDRLANLHTALERLAALEGVDVVRCSRVYESDPVGGPAQPDYLNAVVEIETELGPHRLLDRCHEIEDELGRVRSERWGPRTIDVDILLFGSLELLDPDLEIPHPRMGDRAFVLLPLLELRADPTLPGRGELSALRLGPDAVLGARPFAPPLARPSVERLP